jgi:L-tyrosine isonitrile synthase
VPIANRNIASLRDGQKRDTAVKKRSYDSQKILQSFNTWAFKRQQPTEPDLLFATVEAAVDALRPIQFVLYWGKGPRPYIDEPERTCLGFISQMTQRIHCAYGPGAQVTLILTDTHAEHNGHIRDVIDSYFAEVAEAARHHGFDTTCLSNIVTAQLTRIRSVTEAPSAELLAKLEPSAAKWYRGDEPVTAGAERYFHLNMIEKQAVEIQFPRAVFVTFNNSDYRVLFPDTLPVFYMYSLRKGFAVKPWFLNAEAWPANENGLKSRAQFGE